MTLRDIGINLDPIWIQESQMPIIFQIEEFLTNCSYLLINSQGSSWQKCALVLPVSFSFISVLKAIECCLRACSG